MLGQSMAETDNLVEKCLFAATAKGAATSAAELTRRGEKNRNDLGEHVKITLARCAQVVMAEEMRSFGFGASFLGER